MVEVTGPPQIVFFTGDLTQRGTAEEFALLDVELKWMWERFRAAGATVDPVLLAVPGNHDVGRRRIFEGCRARTRRYGCS